MAGGRGERRFRQGGTFRRKADAGRRRPVQHEKIEQANILKLAALVVVHDPETREPAIWEIGRPRSRGKGCPACGTFVPGDMGMRQTPGHPDLVLFLKPIGRHLVPRLLYWETKAGKNTTSAEQDRFLGLAQQTGVVLTGVGDYNAFIAFLVAEGYITTDSVPHYRRPPAAAGGTPA